MKVYRELEGSLPDFRNAVVTIGTFDGVHIGHRKIIAQLKSEARKINGETIIITFHPHPRKIVSSVPGDVKILNTLPEKLAMLEKAGIDNVVVIPFDHSFANLSAEAYIKDFLYKYFKPQLIIIGYDHRFGKGRIGDYQLLKESGPEFGFEVQQLSEELMHEAVISSTKIRHALLANEIEAANQLLGYPYFFEGVVIEGNKLGRTIGFPTANLHVSNEEKLIPGNGVYAVEIEFSKEKSAPNRLKGMMNIGVRPTVDGKKRVIEVNIFNFNEDIYGHTLIIYVKNYLRGEVKFNGLEELKQQLKTDQEQAARILESA